MMKLLMILCYSIVAYGACNVIVFGSGPFKIIEVIRETAFRISRHFGELFACMMCLPANFGIVASLVDFFLLPGVSFTPFNILMENNEYWALIVLCDGAFTSGIVWLIHNFENFFEKYADKVESEIPYQDAIEDDIIMTDDITNDNGNERKRDKGSIGDKE